MPNATVVSMIHQARPEGVAETINMATERVLVVDDEEDLLELIRYNLSKEGYQVRCVSTGEAAIREAKNELPDLILLDLLLPSVDGFGV
jgi:two-component system, OmpR family, alkaline phosphatase synthesis response regulator PhoP